MSLSPEAHRSSISLAQDDLPVAVETRGLHKRFGANHVLQGADLRIPAGSAAAILGPSGTGKSVLIKHILGLLRPDEGEVLVEGQRLAELSRTAVIELRRGIGVMFQDGALFSSMTVYENTAFPLRQHTNLPEHRVRAIAMEHLDAVGLAAAKDKYPAELSGGMRKRAGMARALVLDPGILLCDEPDSGLDPVRTALLGELLRARHDELGGTLVIITHNLDLARVACEYVAMLWRGKIIWSGPIGAAYESGDPFVRQFLAAETQGPLGMDA